jgi:hypothetical protein
MRVWCVGLDGVNAWGHSRIGDEAGEGVGSGKKALDYQAVQKTPGVFIQFLQWRRVPAASVVDPGHEKLGRCCEWAVLRAEGA